MHYSCENAAGGSRGWPALSLTKRKITLIKQFHILVKVFSCVLNENMGNLVTLVD